MFRFFILLSSPILLCLQPKLIFNNMNRIPSLFICILLDVIGGLSYVIPIIGEWGDIVWAPLSAYLFYRMFGGRTGKIGSIINFAEELLPFTDFIPTFTIGYIFRKYIERRN